MSSEKTIVLITRGNSGLGLALASLLLQDASKHVLFGSQSIEKGETAVRDLLAQDCLGKVELVELDVAIEESISAAAKSIESRHGRLDALVNNAAIGRPDVSLSNEFTQCFQTNSTGPFLVTEAFAPLFKLSTSTPRIINISSGGGSITHRLDRSQGSSGHSIGCWGLPYCASKAALNLITAAQSVVYGEQGIKVFAYTPGFVASNLGPHNTVENGARSASEGAKPIMEILEGRRDGESGGFLSADGQYPW